MGFSRQEYWSGLPSPPPGDLPDPEIEPTSLTSPELVGVFFTLSALGPLNKRSFPGTSLVAQTEKNLLAMQETGCDPWVGKNPWRRAWQPTPVFLPGESHGQRSLVGYSPGVAESDTTEAT